MEFLKKVNAFVFGLAVFVAISCDSGKKNDPAPEADPTPVADPATPVQPERACRLDEISTRIGTDEVILLLDYDQQDRLTKITTKENGVVSNEDTRLQYGANNKVINVVYYRNNIPGSFQSLSYNLD